MAEEKIETKEDPSKYDPSEENEKLIKKWNERFKHAERFRRPYQEKWLRMHKLYRAFREGDNYAYETRLMPAIAFKIVETVVSRLATAKRKVRILPREKKDVESEAIQSWDDLINYNFDIIKLKKKLIRWIKAMAIYGNGIARIGWKVDESKDYDDPELDIIDLWEFLPAPETEDLQGDCPWVIQRMVKSKEEIERGEKNREKSKMKKLYNNLQYVENISGVKDWKKERYEVNTAKMAQIEGGTRKEQKEGEKITEEKQEEDKRVEIWQIWDYEENKLIVIANKEVLIRNDENPYININGGRIFIDLPDHILNWEFWAIGHIEPVETTIIEIADLRNQRMDNVILMLNPVTKIIKNSGIDKNSIIFEPGAKWEMRRFDDVMVERPPDLSRMGVEEEAMMREDIEQTLALSEYMQGASKSAQEPASKVAMLLGQGNLRLNLNADNIADALTQLVNSLIQLNQEFISEDKLYRVVGDDVSFKEFKKENKKVKVDALVEIDSAIPPDRERRLDNALLLYDKFVAEDKPDVNNPEAVKKWERRKRAIQEMILEEMSKGAYKEILLGEEEPEVEKEEKELPKEDMGEIPPLPHEEALPAGNSMMEKMKGVAAKIPIINKLVR